MTGTLSSEKWGEVSFDIVSVTFIRGEAFKHKDFTESECRLIRTPDLTNSEENLARCLLLARMRGGLLSGIPPDTVWYEVRYLKGEHLDELRVLRYPYWISPNDENELGKVGLRIPKRLQKEPKALAGNQVLEYFSADPNQWQSPILWGHSKAGPFTILEGTHRLVSHYAEAQASVTFRNIVYVGLSESSCHWHFPDQLDVQYEVNRAYAPSR